MATVDEVIERWARWHAFRSTPFRARVAVPSAPNLIASASDRTIFSYGRHFPLARWVPDHAEGIGNGLFVVNGDRWRGGGWTATHRHQEAIRRTIDDLVKRHEGIRSIIVPFSAMEGAGINVDTVRPVDVRPDRFDRTYHHADVDLSVFGDKFPSRPTIDNLTRWKAEKDGWELAGDRQSFERRSRYYGTNPDWACSIQTVETDVVVDSTTYRHTGSWGSPATTGDNPTSSRVVRLHVTRSVRWFDCNTTYRDRETGSLYDVPPDDYHRWNACDRIERLTPCNPIVTYSVSDNFGRNRYPLASGSLSDNTTIRFSWETTRHWLGDSLFDAVRVSESREVVATYPADEWSAMSWEERDNATPLDATSRHDGRGHVNVIRTVTHRKQHRWLSSFDYNEPAPLYFLCALPNRKPATVADAIESLAPPIVKGARARGLDVKRQGDIFAIPVSMGDAEILRLCRRVARLTQWTMGAAARPYEIHPDDYSRNVYADGMVVRWTPVKRRGTVGDTYRDALRNCLSIHGTTHTADVVAVAPDGRTFVKGTMRHVPSLDPNRRGGVDHRPLPLGEGWHLVVRNTVPRNR